MFYIFSIKRLKKTEKAQCFTAFLESRITNKLKSKGIIVIGDDEALKNEFVIRLFDNDNSKNQEEIIIANHKFKILNIKDNFIEEVILCVYSMECRKSCCSR